MVDVNGSRFHLLLGEQDWRPVVESGGTGLTWDGREVSLRRRERRLARSTDAGQVGSEHRRGAGADRWGNIFWIREDREAVHYQPGGTRDEGLFWHVERLTADPRPEPAGDFMPCPAPPLPSPPTLSGLTVTRCELLVVGTLAPAGLLVFDLPAGGPPSWLRWPENVPFAPFDLSPTADGGFWVLDREHSRLWRLDRRLGIVSIGEPIETKPPTMPDFHPLDGSPTMRPGLRFPGALQLDSALPLGIPTAVAVEALPDDSVLVLESDPTLPYSRLHRFRNGGPAGTVSFQSILMPILDPDEHPFDGHLAGHDLALVGIEADPSSAGLRGELYVASRDGRQAFLFTLEVLDLGPGELRLRPRADLLPLREFSGKALISSPVVGSATVDVLYDFGNRWLPVSPWPARRYEVRGVMQRIFDGNAPGTVWHRLILDACLPDGTAVRVESRSADEMLRLHTEPFRPEPALVHRASGSELPFARPYGDTPRAGAGSWELLLQEAEGRFIELRLTLEGSGRVSPRLRALRLYYPRFSYLEQYLPAIYGEDPVSSSFVERFLANLEGMYTAIEGTVAAAEVLFDPRTAPAESLDWLAGWLGAVLDPEWSEARRRLFVSHAVELFRHRGTTAGMIAAIRLAVDPCDGDELFDGLWLAAQPSTATACSVGASRPRAVIRRPNGDIRLVERFLTRTTPPSALGDASQLEGPALVPVGEPWRPDHGSAALHRRYREFLRHRRDEVPSTLRFPPLPPAPPELQSWRIFVAGLGFPYTEARADDVSAWRAFLSRRYRHIDALNRAHQRADARAWSSFQALSLPTALPDVRAELDDWIAFVSLALPLKKDAHQFTVLIPARPGEAEATLLARKARAEAAAGCQKPAHTELDVQLFWALFRVGGARLGLDTILGEGSRFTALTLGSGYLGTGRLADRPWAIDAACCAISRPTLGMDPSACEPRL